MARIIETNLKDLIKASHKPLWWWAKQMPHISTGTLSEMQNARHLPDEIQQEELDKAFDTHIYFHNPITPATRKGAA